MAKSVKQADKNQQPKKLVTKTTQVHFHYENSGWSGLLYIFPRHSLMEDMAASKIELIFAKYGAWNNSPGWWAVVKSGSGISFLICSCYHQCNGLVSKAKTVKDLLKKDTESDSHLSVYMLLLLLLCLASRGACEQGHLAEALWRSSWTWLLCCPDAHVTITQNKALNETGPC